VILKNHTESLSDPEKSYRKTACDPDKNTYTKPPLILNNHTLGSIFLTDGHWGKSADEKEGKYEECNSKYFYYNAT
jgi:hypothetical protein